MPSRDLIERVRKALGDRYTVITAVGRGGNASIFGAYDQAGQRVAIKVLHPELAVSVAADRFLREIRYASQLNHPHIARLLDSGETDYLLWFAMPYLPGETLRQVLRREQRLPVDQACRVACDATSPRRSRPCWRARSRSSARSGGRRRGRWRAHCGRSRRGSGWNETTPPVARPRSAAGRGFAAPGERAVSRWLPAPLPPGAPRARHRSLRDPAVCTSRGEPVAAAGRSGLRRILERVVRPLERRAARRQDADLRCARASRRAGAVPDRLRHGARHRTRAWGRAAGDGATVELGRHAAPHGGRLRCGARRPGGSVGA